MIRPVLSTTVWSSSNQSCPIWVVVQTHPQPAVGGQAPQVGGQLHRGRPPSAIHGVAGRHRDVAAHQREQHVDGTVLGTHPDLEHRRTGLGVALVERRADVATAGQVVDRRGGVARTDRLDSGRRFHGHQRCHRVGRQQRLGEMLRLAEGDHGAHAGSLTLVEFDVDQTDATATLAHRGDQLDRTRIGRGQEVRRHRHRLEADPGRSLRRTPRGPPSRTAPASHRRGSWARSSSAR